MATVELKELASELSEVVSARVYLERREAELRELLKAETAGLTDSVTVPGGVVAWSPSKKLSWVDKDAFVLAVKASGDYEKLAPRSLNSSSVRTFLKTHVSEHAKLEDSSNVRFTVTKVP